MIPTYRIQTDRPHANGATATVYFLRDDGEIAMPGWTVPITPGMTLEQIADAADAVRNAPQDDAS